MFVVVVVGIWFLAALMLPAAVVAYRRSSMGRAWRIVALGTSALFLVLGTVAVSEDWVIGVPGTVIFSTMPILSAAHRSWHRRRMRGYVRATVGGSVLERLPGFLWHWQCQSQFFS